jgi:hypothetical protein
MSFDALLKRSGINLELLTDLTMYEFFEQGLRGGITQTSHRKMVANNPDLANYNPEEINRWLSYSNATNLYGFAMCQNLPYKNFRWGEAEKYTLEKIKSFKSELLKPPDMNNYNPNEDNEDTEECILMVDIDYPDEIHDKHRDLPLLPERMQITEDMQSDYAKTILGDNKISQCPKLVPNLMNKRNYVIHIKNLKFALEEGLILKKVHKVLEFTSRPWMRDYIVFNTKQRNATDNEFEKSFYKLMNNAVFGKTMENLRARSDFGLINTKTKKFQKWVRDPSFKSRNIITENLVVCQRAKKTLCLNKPVYVGMCILDLSKLHMQTVWYRHIKRLYSQAILCYMDTDSFIFSIENKTRPQLSGPMFDNSGLSKDHPLYSPDNKKTLGCMKDEMDGKQISKVICLAPKIYSVLTDDSIIKKAKGVSSAVVKNEIEFNDYDNTLKTGEAIYKSNTSFRSFDHQLYTIKTEKKSLSAYENKRYLLEDGITSYPYGYYKINSKK